MSYFAKQVKQRRTELGLTMQALADRAQVSKSMICKIEQDEVQPTLDVAARLSKALGKTLSEMLHTPKTNPVIYLAKGDQGVWEDAEHIKRRNISPVFEGLTLDWLQVELPPKATLCKLLSSDKKGGEVEKYVLVTKGSLDITVSEEVYHLDEGDSLYFKAGCDHAFSNPNNEPVEYFIVMRYL